MTSCFGTQQRCELRDTCLKLWQALTHVVHCARSITKMLFQTLSSSMVLLMAFSSAMGRRTRLTPYTVHSDSSTYKPHATVGRG
jgi:hypothetical protein